MYPGTTVSRIRPALGRNRRQQTVRPNGSGNSVDALVDRDAASHERDPVEDVALARLDLLDPEVLEHLGQHEQSADDHRRTFRLEPRSPAPLVERHAASRSMTRAISRRESEAVHELGVVGRASSRIALTVVAVPATASGRSIRWRSREPLARAPRARVRARVERVRIGGSSPRPARVR